MSFQRAFETKYSADELRGFIDSSPALTWSCSSDGSAEFFNQRWLDYTGLSSEEARGWGWTVALHPDDLTALTEYWQSVLASSEAGEIEGRLRRFDGVYRWFLFRATPSFDNDGRVVKWFGTNTDIEDRKRAEFLLAGENLVLEMTAKGNSLESILEALCRVVEETASECYCSIILFDPSGSKIQQAIAPSLPSSYNDRFPGVSVDREGGPCTEAARRKIQVIVSDVASDTRLDRVEWRTDALMHDLKACWSTTISASTGIVLGTFAIYWREPRTPTEQDQKIIEQVTHLAAVAIESKNNEAALKESEERFRLIVDTIPGFVCTLSAEGEVELLNRQVLEYFGKTADELKNWATSDAVHPDDLPRVIDAWRLSVQTGQPHDLELRQRRADGVYRWFQSRAHPERDAKGRVTRWYMLLTDIDDRKLAESEITRAFDEKAKSEAELRTIIDAIPQLIVAIGADGKFLSANQAVLEYTGLTKEEVSSESFGDVFHPEDSERLREDRDVAISRGVPFEYERRVRRRDGRYHWFLIQYNPLLDEQRHVVRWYATGTDIDDRKRAEDVLRSNEQSLRLTVDSIPGFVSTMSAAGEAEFVSRQALEYFGKTIEQFKNWVTNDTFHPDDLPNMIDTWSRAIETGQPFELEARRLRADGVYRWFHLRSRPQRDAEGRIVRWYNLTTDIDDRKKAEEALRRSKAYLTEAQRLSRTGSFGCRLSTGEMFWSEETFRIYGYDRSTQPALERVLERVHPEDRALVQERIDQASRDGQGCQVECRLLMPDDSVKHVYIVAHASKNESGIIEFIGAVMDVTAERQASAELENAFEEIKRLKDRLHDENVVLREQIDQVSMFEEIVGSSPALKTVLSSIVKVAPTDSTVLITGETGTGKELIARAIHKGSPRASQAFVSVNCAAIPSSLIASELFGHEKGAFTGAVQRRQGRFELAHSGTIFLDEIGELPTETQVALLRVLQERQFERVGGSHVIPTDVRIIAATNSDLPAGIASGRFRADLFYRLNVFPIDVPPLRQRKEDIPMLLEYFVKRYADKARKRIDKIDKNTLKLCQSYHWPGNIRELQNIIERSVILCAGDTLRIDDAWLLSQSTPPTESLGSLKQNLQNYEKELIETALAESSGKVAGPNGAAAKLGVPRSTLDLKIKQLNIEKHTIRYVPHLNSKGPRT